jgi:2-hydroxymuconate-semialdehyde hydrolase
MILSNRKAQAPRDPRKQTRLRKLWVSLSSVAGFLSLGWFVLAFKSGAFIRAESTYAVSPGNFTDDAMAVRKKVIDLGNYKIAYIDEGMGEPVILLHGCPFSVYEWHEVAPLLARHFRVIAPDLLGLGDTPVRLNDDYRLPQDVRMVTELMDQLGIRSARFIGHDHGGAILQLLMQQHPDRIEMAIFTNVEAYDQWPSKPETGDLHLITNPLSSPLVFAALHSRRVQRHLYSIAVVNQSTLTDETLDAFASEHLASALRWQRLRRFFASQLDPANNRLTLDAVPAMRRFTKPVLILWGEKDTNFGPAIAKRLARDIPGVMGISWLSNSAHLPMLEQPQKYADVAYRFFNDGTVDQDARMALADARR